MILWTLWVCDLWWWYCPFSTFIVHTMLQPLVIKKAFTFLSTVNQQGCRSYARCWSCFTAQILSFVNEKSFLCLFWHSRPVQSLLVLPLFSVSLDCGIFMHPWTCLAKKQACTTSGTLHTLVIHARWHERLWLLCHCDKQPSSSTTSKSSDIQMLATFLVTTASLFLMHEVTWWTYMFGGNNI